MLYVLSSSTKVLLIPSNLPYSDLTLEQKRSLAARGMNIPSNLVVQPVFWESVERTKIMYFHPRREASVLLVGVWGGIVSEATQRFSPSFSWK